MKDESLVYQYRSILKARDALKEVVDTSDYLSGDERRWLETILDTLSEVSHRTLNGIRESAKS